MRLLTNVFAVVLLALGATPRAALAADVDFTGSWSGSFAIQFADGRVVQDSAWLELKQSGKSVTGSAGPKAQEQGPIRQGAVAGGKLTFVVDSTQGKELRFTLAREGEKLLGEAVGEIGNDKVRVKVDVARVTASASAASSPDALREKMLALDVAMFDAFNHCDQPGKLDEHAKFFAKDVEFFHDLAGVTLGADGLIAATKQNVCGKFRRELDRESFRAYPIPGYGAIAMGTHRFCHTPTTCEGIAEFTTVWREKDGEWKITKALSYAHRSVE